MIEVLDVMGQDSMGAVVDSLNDLVQHYAQTISATPSGDVYDEILAVRSYANGILKRCGSDRWNPDLSHVIGWLSCLLAIAACDMKSHAASHLWCADAERRSESVGNPKLAGWSTLTRSMIAFYQGRPRESAVLAARGREITSRGTVAHAKLAAQEMRATAMTGDSEGMEAARRYAAQAISALPVEVESSGAFSIALAEDPPYTATSLMLLGRPLEAVAATKRVIQSCYPAEMGRFGQGCARYSRTLLILALAQAGAGDLDEAVSAGCAALVDNHPAWPTMVLAGKLDKTLMRNFPSAQVHEYRDRYLATMSHARNFV
ncbi:hypothetical protein ACMA1D_16495 [Streptomyces sp. 796.1]|uniref:hypothetical protein n=1 Tax=Streptomyces sp. 796.1 TaxID=3163029 RepID=UPI0039C8C237